MGVRESDVRCPRFVCRIDLPDSAGIYCDESLLWFESAEDRDRMVELHCRSEDYWMCDCYLDHLRETIRDLEKRMDELKAEAAATESVLNALKAEDAKREKE